jgi:3-methyladenine DNA glycosylase Tag
MPIPERIDAKSLDDYLEIITKAIFQAGLRWSVIEAKWPAFQKAFENFNTAKVAAFTAKDVDRLANNADIIRSPKKIEGTVKNAQVLMQLEQEFDGFKEYLRSFATYDELSADIKKRFAFMGEMNVYYLLFRVREPVPPFDEWIHTIPGEHPRMREMVELAQKQDSNL